MKKWIALVLALCTVCAFAGCAKKPAEVGNVNAENYCRS